MELKQEKKNGATIFHFSGRLDSVTSLEVEKTLLNAIASGDKKLIFDLSALDYLSSAGIRVLVQCYKKVEAAQGHVFLCSLPKPIENVLYVTGFLPYFQIFDKTDQAVLASHQAP